MVASKGAAAIGKVTAVTSKPTNDPRAWVEDRPAVPTQFSQRLGRR